MKTLWFEMTPGETLSGGDEYVHRDSLTRDYWDGGVPWMSIPNDRIGTELRHDELGRKRHILPEEETKYTIAKDISESVARAASGSVKALTNDDGKPPLAYLPWDAIREMAHVQSYGQKKYGDFYNYKKGMELGRNLSCAIRHIAAFMDGEDLDKESQCSHLGHALCRVAFALQNIHDETAIDDRYKKLP